MGERTRQGGGITEGYTCEVLAECDHGAGVAGTASASRRRSVATSFGIAIAVCCVAAFAGGWRGHVPLGLKSALGMKKLLSGRGSNFGMLEIVHDASWGYGRASFGLTTPDIVHRQQSKWRFEFHESPSTGPSEWAAVHADNILCAEGQMQSPINILSADSTSLSFPAPQWRGFGASDAADADKDAGGEVPTVPVCGWRVHATCLHERMHAESHDMLTLRACILASVHT
jgi:hypothetical protein